MSDLPERLRAAVGDQVGDWSVLVHEAADEIERLREELKTKRTGDKKWSPRIPPDLERDLNELESRPHTITQQDRWGAIIDRLEQWGAEPPDNLPQHEPTDPVRTP